MKNIFIIKNIDFKAIQSDFNYKKLVLLLLVLIVFFGSSDNLYSIADKYFVPIVSSFKTMLVIDLLSITIAAFVFFNIYNTIIKERLIPTINSIISCFTIIIIYLFTRFSKHYTFTSTSFSDLLYYSDIFMFLGLLQLLEFKSYKIQLKKEKSILIEDVPYNTTEQDLYSRSEYATSIAKLINNSSTTENSFGIAIIGNWGAGKTNFMQCLKRELDRNKLENETLEFNPWKVNKPDAMVDDFLTTLSSHLKKYNKSVSHKIKKYSKQLFQSSKNIEHRLIDTLINLNDSEETLDELNKTISGSILKTGKRLIVFIDDLDRLTNKEIIDVLRIIRNTGNFANTYYVVALDYVYAINGISSSNQITNAEDYLKKIFQLTITLPAYKKDVIVDALINHLGITQFPQNEQTELLETIKKLSLNSESRNARHILGLSPYDCIEDMLENIRDVKRFANSFNIVYNILKNEVLVIDLFLLELIKHSNIEIYIKLADKSLLDYDKDNANIFTLNKNIWEEYKNKNKDKRNLYATEKALNLLIGNYKQKSNRAFIDPENYYLFFSYQLFDLISINEFNTLIEQSNIDDIVSRFKQWKKDKKENSLENITNVYTNFNSSELFKKYCTALLVYSLDSKKFFFTTQNLLIKQGDVAANRIYRDVQDSQVRINTYCNEIIEPILQDNRIDSFNRARIYNTLLTPYIYNREPDNIESAFTKDHLQKRIFELFSSFLNNYHQYDMKVYDFLMLNDSHRENHESRIVHYKPAMKRMRTFLKSDNKIAEDYIRHFIRPVFKDQSGVYAFEPFADEIFEEPEHLKQFIINLQSNDKSINDLKKIILNRFDSIYQNPRLFRFKAESDEDEIIIPHLIAMKILPNNPVAAQPWP